MSKEIIYKQDVIDAVEILLEQTEEDADVKTWNNAIRGAINSIKHHVPSTQTEIVYCGDCKYKDDGIDEDGMPFLKCLHGRSYGGTRINDYCSWAERREE